LWTPPWPSIEPSTYDSIEHVEYGTSNETFLLCGLMDHSICLDTYGTPSREESAAGMPVQGDGAVVPYNLQLGTGSLDVQGTQNPKVNNLPTFNLLKISKLLTN
jgi:hypothetical protein